MVLNTLLIGSVFAQTQPKIQPLNVAKNPSQLLILSDVWIRFAPKNARVLAAFMRIRNLSSKNARLISASVKGFERVEFHQTRRARGMMTMQPLDFINIPAGKTLTLKPGQTHLMLIRPERALKKGAVVPIRLVFDGGGRASNVHILVNARVREL